MSAPAVLLEPGAELPARRVGPITRTDIVRYAGAGGDFNPIHHDEEFAREAGMPTVFAMGLMHGGMLAQHLAGCVGLDRVRKLTLRYTAQVWPGDELVLGGVVEAVTDSGDERLAIISLRVSRQTGEVAVTGEAIVAAPG